MWLGTIYYIVWLYDSIMRFFYQSQSWVKNHLSYCFMSILTQPNVFLFTRIRYAPGWSAKTQKMGYSVCLAPELPYIDSSRQFWPDIKGHVTNESAKATLSHSQIPDKEDSIHPLFNSCNHANPLRLSGSWARIHGLMNLALAQRQRRDIVGPRSPLTPFKLTGEWFSFCPLEKTIGFIKTFLFSNLDLSHLQCKYIVLSVILSFHSMYKCVH